MNKAVVIGGGPAGLTAARTLQEKSSDWTPEVFEAHSLVGGISRTESHNGYRFDIGGHRFFTKVDEVTEFWRRTLKDEFVTRERMSRIYYNGKFYSYPLKIFNALTNLGPFEAAAIMCSYAKVRISPLKEEETFDQWVTNRFGKRLFDTFFKTYTEKVWGIPCSEIRADWAAQRIKNLSVSKAVWNALTGANDTVSLIEEFEYPRLGPGQMWEKCTQDIEEDGGQVVMNTRVEKVHRTDQHVDAVTVRGPDGEERRVEGDQFINSMDLRTLLRVMDPPPPPAVMEAADKLKYRDFLIVTLVLDHADPFPDNWIYVHSPEVQVGRIQNFRAWSPDMVPDEGTSSLGMEYFCHEGDGLWEMSDEDLIKQAGEELEKIGLAPASSVIDGAIIRQPKAYPVYDADYTPNLEIVRAWLEGFDNFQTVGRNGMHRYNNQDHSMLTAMLAADNILGGSHDLWNVNVERSYHEEFVKADKKDGEPPRKDDDDIDGDKVAELAAYSAVIPAKNAEATIARCVSAALAADPAPAEVIVVDDASTDRTAEIARKHGATVISHEEKTSVGPARARNTGAAHATTDNYVFIDADVVIEPSAPKHLLREIGDDPQVAAAFGSYGSEQACPNLVARYANLRHHYFHQTGKREANSFWTGLGVIRAQAFSRLNGFSNDILKPAMEDVEIGHRLAESGYRIRLVPKAQGKHLKNWTLKQLWRDDIHSRAIPWSTLIVHGRAPAKTLNTRIEEKAKAVAVGFALLCLAVAFFVPAAWFGVAIGAITYAVMNEHFFKLLYRKGGLRTAIAGVGLHAAYHFYSSACFSLVAAAKMLRLPPLAAKSHAWVLKPQPQRRLR
ncbi:glycosyltransferase [Parvularcula sp. ZS-1/3]|uniref:Glycosyltransferase n=2 Tax=Parvularcula mediterranea TaxID=2732508 RepID=A0A7Y3RN47_9PROT|nr:glycosyltransferase [Parvularcula mediterranea]